MAQKSKKLPNGRDLSASVKKSGASGTYLLLGEEEADKEDFIKLVKESLRAQNPSISRFHCASDEFLNGAAQAQSSDMFQPFKIVIIRRIEEALKKKSNVAVFHDLVQTLPDTTVLILTSSENKMSAALSRVSSQMEAAIFWKRFENELAPYIFDYMKKENRSISSDAANIIIEFCGRDRLKIDEALQILTFGTESDSISAETVHKMLTSTREVTVFECVDALFEGRKNSLSLCARTLSGDTHELQLLSLIGRRLSQTERYLELKKAGAPVDLLRDLGIMPRQQSLFEQSCRRFSIDKIRRLYTVFYQTEKSLKSGGARKNILANPLSDFLYSILH